MMRHHFASLLFSVCVILGLSSCGGGGAGGGKDGGGQTASASVTGTAATGAPLYPGMVTVKDANGTTRTSDINSDGSYTLDVTGLAAPFLFKAEGMAGGSRITLYSVSLSAPNAGASIVANITPLTDSIVANIAETPQDLFFLSPTQGKITATSIQLAQDALKNALSSLMAAASVSPTFDLIKTPFAADKTGIDALLESVKVTVEVRGTTPVIELVNKYNPLQVVTLMGTGTPVQSGTISQPSLPNLSKIDEFAAQYTAAMASPSTMEAQLPALFEDNYLNSGENKAAAISKIKSESPLVGAKIGKPVIETCNSAGDICRVQLMRIYWSAEVEGVTQTLKKQANGSWKLYGNQYLHEFAITPYSERGIRLPSDSTQTLFSGLQIYVNKLHAGSAIVYIEKTGGGTEEFARLKRDNFCPFQDGLIFDNPWEADTCPNVLRMNDQDVNDFIAVAGNNPKFTIRLYSDTNYATPITGEGTGVYSNYSALLPLKWSQYARVDAPFPQLADWGITNFMNLGPSGQLNLHWKNAHRAVPVYSVDIKLITDTYTRFLGGNPLIGQEQGIFIGMDQPDVLSDSHYRSVFLIAKDGLGRKYVTKYYNCGSQWDPDLCN